MKTALIAGGLVIFGLLISNVMGDIPVLINLKSAALVVVGTIIGLINVLNHMGDASQIGHGMAISLLTTFYGLLLANLLFVPLAGKISTHIHRETRMLNIVIEGVLAICDDCVPIEISHRLQAFIENSGNQKPPKASAGAHPWQRLGAVLGHREGAR